MAFLGAPNTRPKEDYGVVNNTVQLNREQANWEAMMLVSWILEGGAGIDDKTVAEALQQRIILHRSKVAMSVHQSEEFLLKFDSMSIRDRVHDARKFHHEGLEIHVRL